MRLVALASVVVVCPLAARGESTGEQLDRYCREIAESGFSGTVLAVRDGQTVLQAGYGFANTEERVENRPETLFEIASLSKQLTAAAILRLEQDERLSTHDPMSDYLPGVPDAYKEVSIYHLLTHTGGLPRGGEGRGSDLEQAVKAHLREPPSGRPGVQLAYSNVDYALLAGIVEVASGQRFEDYCREALFGPAGMTSTGFCGEDFSDASLALGYSRDSDVGRPPHVDPYPPMDEFGYEYRGMGGVVTNVLDLHRWNTALEGERVLSKEAKEKFFRRFRGNYACGWEVFQFPDGRRCIGHGGGVRGFVCKFWMFPEDRSLLVVLSNRDDFNFTWLNGMYNILFDVPEEQRVPSRRGGARAPAGPKLPKVVAATDEELDRIAGEYVSTGHLPLGLVVRRRGAGLIAEISPPAEAIPADGEFLEQVRLATEIIEALEQDDVGPIAENMAPGIPPSWPETVRNLVWPRHLAASGKLECHAVLGAEGPENQAFILVWLLLEHADDEAVAMLGFRGDRLQLLVLDMSEYLCPSDSEISFLKREHGSYLMEVDAFLPSVLTPRGDGRLRLDRGGIGLSFERQRDVE